jgi:cytochrome c peroxidase
MRSIDNKLHDLKIQLGKRLFEDPNLSHSGEMSCATCHKANMGFSDGRDFSLDNQGNPLPFNTPSIQYIAYNYYFGWTGKFPRLQDHLDALMLNPKLMNQNWAKISQELSADEKYKASFLNAGYSEISRSSISDAIIQYEYSLAKPSRYDSYLLGDTQKLTKYEQQGYTLFKEFGCTSCHQGINLGGNLRQKFGLMKDVFSNKETTKNRDYGYFTTTQREEDKFYFRVPSLRNVSNTAPYFHDGSAKTLYQAVEIMFINQLGIKPKQTDLELIIAFLHTLEPSQ